VARLPVWREGIRFPKLGCQVCPRLAGLRRDIAAGLIADYGNHTAEWAYFRDIPLTPAL